MAHYTLNISDYYLVIMLDSKIAVTIRCAGNNLSKTLRINQVTNDSNYIWHFIIMLPTDQHVSISVVSNGEQMWRHLSTSFTAVKIHDALGVDWQTTVWVDDNAEQA